MARQPRGRDWQERAFEEAQLQRPERAGVPSDVPELMKTTTDRRRRSSWRATAIAVMIVIAAIIIRIDLNDRAPSLTTSCTTPAFALSSTSPSVNSTERWAATGPAGARFVLTIGVARLAPGSQPGSLRSIPEPGHDATTAGQAVRGTVLPSSCKTHGAFSIGLPAGHYTVRMFRLEGSGAAIRGVPVASKPITIGS